MPPEDYSDVYSRLGRIEQHIVELTSEVSETKRIAKSADDGVRRINGTIAAHSETLQSHESRLSKTAGRDEAFITKESVAMWAKLLGIPLGIMGIILTLLEVW